MRRVGVRRVIIATGAMVVLAMLFDKVMVLLCIVGLKLVWSADDRLGTTISSLKQREIGI